MCKVKGFLSFGVGGVLLIPSLIVALDDRVQDLPAMGWNSWNYYHCTINESIILSQAVAMAKKSTTANWEGKLISMKDVGYTFINLDDCWEGARTNRILDYDHSKFPKGFPWLCDTIRDMGLIPGLYTSAGTGTCQRFPAQYGYDWEDAFQYAKWGFQYLKEDWCNVPSQYTNKEGAITLYSRCRDALKKAADSVYKLKIFTPDEGKPRYFTFSLCNWGAYQSWTYGEPLGHSARMSGDIAANWNSVVGIVNQCISNNCVIYNRRGFYNDPDMLEVGNGLNTTENQAHFDLWCQMQSPLLTGNNLATMNNSVFTVLTNREVIAINQDSLPYGGRRVRQVNTNLELWYKRCHTRSATGQVVTDSTKMKKSIIIFNRASSATTYSVRRADPLELGNTAFIVRDLWLHRVVDTLETGMSTLPALSVAAHGTTHLLFTPYDATSIDAEISRISSNRLVDLIKSRRTAGGFEVLVPFSGNVSVFDVQGKLLASFISGKDGQWCSVPAPHAARGTFIVKAAVKDRVLTKAVVLAR